MKRSNILTAIVAVWYLAGCSSNEAGKEPQPQDTVKAGPAIVKPSGPPARVSGTFKGILPCDNCRETEAILTIKDDKYNYTRLLKGMKTRGNNISNKSGYCVFDGGIVKLLSNDQAKDMFRIISEDSIKPLDTAGKPLKGKTDYFLVRSAKQEKL